MRDRLTSPAEGYSLNLQDYDLSGLGNMGTPDSPTIWLCGIEFGEAENRDPSTLENTQYTVEKQWGWGYNQKAHKLMCCIEGRPITDAFEFAKEKNIFASSDCDYLLTNLFPENCLTVKTWSLDAQQRTGFEHKADYIDYIRTTCFPKMRLQVKSHKPKLFIGVGVSHERDFVSVVSEPAVKCELAEFTVGQHKKCLRLYPGETPLVVIPHLSSPSGLNSNESIEKAAQIIRDRLL